jgi:sulfite reductase beta subunit-like hemoprotein
VARDTKSEPITLENADASQMSKVERLKAGSQGLFWLASKDPHSFGAELDALTRGEAQTIGNDAKELSKYFGIYKQQERIEGRKSGDYIFMVRLKLPAGGELSPEQWLALDEAADRFADGTLRITTRQGVQFHHVRGKSLGPLIRHLSQRYEHRGYEMTTLGACGDVNRNTMCSPVDDLRADPPLRARELALQIAAVLSPVAGASAYYQIFLEDDEAQRVKAITTEEPIYGAQYLPRKFKVGIAHPRDGSVDLLTQDVGLLPVIRDGRDDQYDLYTGGGLGITHNNPKTQQLLGLYLGRVPREQVVETVKSIALLQKENGERKDRKLARWKYTIRRMGADAVKAALRERFGIRLEDAEPAPLPPNDFALGWHAEAGDGDLWWLGLPVLSGRLRDRDGERARSAVRAIVSEIGTGVRCTANQDLLLCHIPGDRRARVEELLAEHGVDLSRVGATRRQALACPAKPTCGLAMTDAENSLPVYLDHLETEGLGEVDVVIRIAGCPNSCSRPPTAEIGIIGYGKNDHQIQVGGTREGDRIGHTLYPRVPESDMKVVLTGLLRAILEHGAGQPAGEFLRDTDPDRLRAWVGYPS